jgi:hypothetical protein
MGARRRPPAGRQLMLSGAADLEVARIALDAGA